MDGSDDDYDDDNAQLASDDEYEDGQAIALDSSGAEPVQMNNIIKIITGDARITSHILSLNEVARVVGVRATQINNGSDVFIDTKGMRNIEHMAIHEILQKKCPLKVRRFISENIAEEWSVNEMTLPHGYVNDKLNNN